MKKKNSQLNIAMLGHKRIPSREGGVEIVVEELSRRLAALGHKVTCYNRRGHHVSGEEFDAAERTSYEGVTLKSVPTLDKKGLAAMTSSAFAALFAAFGKYDAVHFHAEGPCAMLWLPKLFGKRCVATIHGLDHQRAKWGRFAKAYILLGEKCAVRFADEIIVLSAAVRDYFLEKYGRQTRFIPNGVNRPKTVPAELIKEAYGLQNSGYILYLGRIVPEKGLRYLVEAFKGVDTEKKLVIAGGSSDTADFEKELHALAADDERIEFIGFVQGRILEELYSNAYVYTLPSDLEGMPLSLLEAMSYSNCCLTSDIPECSQVIGDCGVTFRKGDVTDLREKLQMLCDDPRLARWYRLVAADHVCSRYDWDAVTAKTIELYTGEKHENFDDKQVPPSQRRL